METIGPLRTALVAFDFLFVVLYPPVVAFFVHQRRRVGWRYFGYGALIFFLFQMITRVPLVGYLSGLLQGALIQSLPLQLVWFTALVLTAGLFEEVGRYAGYRWLMRNEEKTWSKAVMYGLGHGGIESMLLVGLGMFNILVMVLLPLDQLPAQARPQVTQQLAAIASTPAWLLPLGAWERLWALPAHVALSVVVLQVFRRKNIAWLWLAIGLHALLDAMTGVAAFHAQLGLDAMTASLLTEGLVALCGLAGLWLIWRLHEPDPPPALPPVPARPSPPDAPPSPVTGP
jgi:uncharacterized membrane protein YhfC